MKTNDIEGGAMAAQGVTLGDALELEPRETEYIEGYGTVYTDTGELVEADEDIPAGYVTEEAEFTEDDAVWAVAKIKRLDLAAQMAKARYDAEKAALTRNYRGEVNRLVNSSGWFRRFVEGRLRKFAEAELLKRNTKKDGSLKANPDKSLKFPEGRLAFSTVNKTRVSAPEGTANVRDAVEWVQAHYPHAIRMEPALDLANLTDAELETFDKVAKGEITLEKAGWDRPTPLKVTPTGESFEVKTGIKVEAAK